MVGGISAAIQTNINLYRQNSDIDLIVEKKNLEKLVQNLEKISYYVEDRKGILTKNYIDQNCNFYTKCHELDTHIKSNNG